MIESRDELKNNVGNRVKNSDKEKRALQIKHERVCADNKNLKAELEDIKKDLNSTNVALKSSKKETKETAYKFEKKVEQLDIKIIDLQEYKMAKVAEEKEPKGKHKKADKNLKSIQEREAKIELDRIQFEKKKFDDKTDDTENNNSPLPHSSLPVHHSLQTSAVQSPCTPLGLSPSNSNQIKQNPCK